MFDNARREIKATLQGDSLDGMIHLAEQGDMEVAQVTGDQEGSIASFPSDWDL